MAGAISTRVRIKGRNVRAARSYASEDEFKKAVHDVFDELRRLRNAAQAEKKAVRRAYRKKKKDTDAEGI
jgi:hypothetical protein